MVIKPTNENGDIIDNSTYANQFLYNLKTRLQNEFPNSWIEASIENDEIWKIDITKIQNENKEEIKNFINYLLTKKPLTLTSINHKKNENLYQNTTNNNSIFNSSSYSNGTISLKTTKDESSNFYKWVKSLGDNSSKVIVWKNYEILNQIANNDPNYEANQSLYEYLFVDGWTPEKYENKGENDTTRNPIFKDKFEFNGKTYKATDFIVSKNDLSSFNQSETISLSKDFGAYNFSASTNDIEKEYYEIAYWISNYSLNNYIISPLNSTNGSHAYTFLLIAFISFITILSIFIVLNYGYLGIMSIFIMAIIIFLSLLMITVFFGDYDSIAISAILASIIVVVDFIVVFFEKIKNEFFKGNSVSKSIKNTISKTIWSMIIKSLFLIVGVGVFYGIISSVLSTFGLVVLISCLAIPIIAIPLIILLSRLMVGMKNQENNPKLIGLWKKEYIGLNQIEKKESIYEQLNVEETLQVNLNNSSSTSNIISGYKTKKWFRFASFKNFSNKHGWTIVLSTISYILIFGVVIFLVSFFANGKTFKSGFNITKQDQNQIVLRVAKVNNQKLNSSEISEVNKILLNNGFDSSSIDSNNDLIIATTNKEFSTEKINEISNELYNLYDVVVIASNYESSNTFKIMQFTLYGALIAIIAMCVFVLFWMGWTKSLSLLIISITSLISFVFMISFGLIQLNPIVSVAAFFGFILFALCSINLLMKVHYKLKTARLEEMTTIEIKDLVYKQTFKTLKPLLIVNGATLIMFILFSIFYSSLPILFSLFMIGFVIVNTLFTIFFLPRIIIWLEALKAKRKRKVILENYWDTEKIKEQTFKGINNIK